MRISDRPSAANDDRRAHLDRGTLPGRIRAQPPNKPADAAAARSAAEVAGHCGTSDTSTPLEIAFRKIVGSACFFRASQVRTRRTNLRRSDYSLTYNAFMRSEDTDLGRQVSRAAISLFSRRLLLASTVVSCGNSHAKPSGVDAAATNHCVPTTIIALDWNSESTAESGDVIFGGVEGSCSAPFVWAPSTDPIVTGAAGGTSTVTTAVTIDRSSFRLVEYRALASGGDMPELCAPQYQVDGSLSITLPEGTIVENGRITISLASGSSLGILRFQFSESFGSWLKTSSHDGGTVEMQVEMMPTASTCAGAIDFAQMSLSGTSGVGRDHFASWADSRCELGQIPVPVDHFASGLDLAGACKVAFDRNGLSGRWSDGSATLFDLQVSPTATIACAGNVYNDSRSVDIPVDVRADTLDGKVVALFAAGSVRAVLSAGELSYLVLSSSVDLPCQSTSSVLPYRPAACERTDAVTAQVSARYHWDSATSLAGDLALYIFESGNQASRAAADRVDRLTF